MAELLARDARFPALVLSETSSLFGFFRSHPFYFSSLLLFLPYLLQLISFLLPLFFATCLLYLTVVSATEKLKCSEVHWSKEVLGFDDLEICEMFLFVSEIDDPALGSEPPAQNGSDNRNHGTSPLKKADQYHAAAAIAASNLEQRGHKNRRKMDSDGSSKEWKRTLACKLFEERHGGGGMDSLWEVYAAESIPPATPKKMKKSKIEAEAEEDVSVVGGGEVCCVQALKLSTGKMRLGMGRRKLGKAIKGLGGLMQLLHVSKKVHNNGDK